MCPSGSTVEVGVDGQVSAVGPEGGAASAVVGRLKLVTPVEGSLMRRADGYFSMASGERFVADPTATVKAGALEGSNVDLVGALVEMIGHGRQFDMQMKVITNAEANDAKASQLLSLN